MHLRQDHRLGRKYNLEPTRLVDLLLQLCEVEDQ